MPLARRRELALHLIGLSAVAACGVLSGHYLVRLASSTPNVRSVIGGWSYAVWLLCGFLLCLSFWRSVVTTAEIVVGIWRIMRGKTP